MNSVAANVLNEARARVPYTGSPLGARGSVDGWPESNEWLAGVDRSSVGAFFTRPTTMLGGATATDMPNATSSTASSKTSGSKIPASSSSTIVRPSSKSSNGRRRLLSVGIDAYPGKNALTGCVGDTLTWSKTLSALGFEVLPTLTDKQATHKAIVDALRDLITTAKQGDVLVFQYSGHGTQVPDTDGDEDDGADEALVPVDFQDGAFLIDDDLRGIFDQLPVGVNLTCFIDCCHSGTITRMLGRNSDIDDPSEGTRFLKRTDEWEDWMRAHERFRDRAQATREIAASTRGIVDRNSLRWVNYSACDAQEVALEHDGNGDFTRMATRVLSGDISRLTHRSFQDAVIGVFGAQRKQTPQLDCADGARDGAFLQPLV
jgi:hypothetical protein